MTPWWSAAEPSAAQSSNPLPHGHFWDAWGDATRTWWAWWLAAVSAPWLRQPWPHAGYWPEEAAASPNTEPAPTPHLRPAAAAALAAGTQVVRPQQKLKTATSRLERRAKTLRRRKVNPGG
jgi:hypothetical protein